MTQSARVSTSCLPGVSDRRQAQHRPLGAEWGLDGVPEQIRPLPLTGCSDIHDTLEPTGRFWCCLVSCPGLMAYARGQQSLASVVQASTGCRFLLGGGDRLYKGRLS